ncbi:MAG: hypothetical protein ABSE05_15420 [Syntrophales bacterium]
MKKKTQVVVVRGTDRISKEVSKSLPASHADVAKPRQEKRFIKSMADWLIKNGDQLTVRSEMTYIIEGLNPRHFRVMFLGMVDSLYNTGDAEEVRRFMRRATHEMGEINSHGKPYNGIIKLRESIDGLIQAAAKRRTV